MMMDTIKAQIERHKLRADLFLKEKTRAFIVDAFNNYHFCYIEKNGEDKVKVSEFTGKLAGQINILNWVDVVRFEKFREREG